MTDDPVSPLAEALLKASHNFTPGDTLEHRRLLITCTVEEVDGSGHVTATDQRGEEHHFERELINRGLSEGFIERGASQ